MSYSKEQKKEYYKKLRAQWEKAKETANHNEIQAIIENHGLKISVSGFAFVAAQMREQGLDGLPYLDMKTFQGWKENGYIVRKGEKSTANGITWVAAKKKEASEEGLDEEKPFLMPKVYKLFHRSQVQDI